MSLRFLVGPVVPGHAPWDTLPPSDHLLTFADHDGADVRLSPGDTLADLEARLPVGWVPDALVLDLAYHTVPECLWSAPWPRLALTADWPLLWHGLRLALPLCARA